MLLVVRGATSHDTRAPPPPFWAEGRMMLPCGELLIDVTISICTNWHSGVFCYNPTSCHPLTFKSQPTSSVCLHELRHADTRGDAKCCLFQAPSARLMIIVVLRGESHTTPPRGNIAMILAETMSFMSLSSHLYTPVGEGMVYIAERFGSADIKSIIYWKYNILGW